MRPYALCALAALSGAAKAGDRLVVQVTHPIHVFALPTTYPVLLRDNTGANAPFALYEVRPGFSTDLVQAAISADPRVVFCEDNLGLQVPENVGAGKGSTIGAVFDDTVYSRNAGLLSQIRWTRRPWRASDRRVRVGVLDTGVSQQSTALRSRVVAWQNVASDRRDPFDAPSGSDSNRNGKRDEAVGHGSMVAGIVAQVAPFAQIVSCRVADSDGQSDAWAIVKGLATSVSYGCEVVNISLGSPERIVAISDVLDWVESKGAVVVAAAGNEGKEGAYHPAALSEAILVTGVDALDRKAPFSNWDRKAAQCAPATGVKSAWWNGSVGVWSGTSFAAPLVAGAIADALRSVPRKSPEAVRAAVRASGTNVDGLNPLYGRKLGNRLHCYSLGYRLGVR